MTSNYRQSGHAKALRQDFGKWLKAKRESLEYTQLDLSRKLNHEYPTTVSQYERGIARVPPEDWGKYADFLGIPHREFAKRALKYYDPHVYMLIFGDDDQAG